MDFILSDEQIKTWCGYLPEEVKQRKDLNAELHVLDEPKELYRQVADLMAEELIAHNKAGQITKWIIPAGPIEQWDHFIERVHAERISMKNLWIFMMDEFLDWESRPLPEDGVYGSLHAVMKRVFARIDPELMCPPEQIIFPDPQDLDAYDNKIEELGGIDTIWAGVGCKGLIAFCEAPHSRYYRISQEQFKNSKTRHCRAERGHAGRTLAKTMGRLLRHDSAEGCDARHEGDSVFPAHRVHSALRLLETDGAAHYALLQADDAGIPGDLRDEVYPGARHFLRRADAGSSALQVMRRV